MEKKFIEVTPDGKVEIEAGKEPLDKQPQSAEEAAAQSNAQDAANDYEEAIKEARKKKKKKLLKSLREEWELLKAKIDHNKAIMNIAEEAEPEVPEESPEQQADLNGDGEFSPEELQILEQLGAEGEAPQEDTPQDPQQEDIPEDVAAVAEQQGEAPEELSEDEIIDIMQQLGYSEAEIAHVVHDHAAPQVDPVDQSKIEANSAKLEDARAAAEQDRSHKQRMNDLEHQYAQKMKDLEAQLRQKELEVNDPEMERSHKQRMLDIEYQKAQKDLDMDDALSEKEHNQRMRDLEYEYAKKEKELILEQKRAEMELKMKMKAQQQKEKAAQKAKPEEVKKSQQEKELKIGTKIEDEHAQTIKNIVKDVKAGKVKPFKEYFQDIAEDHLKELKDYYTRLVAMEEEGKKESHD